MISISQHPNKFLVGGRNLFLMQRHVISENKFLFRCGIVISNSY